MIGIGCKCRVWWIGWIRHWSIYWMIDMSLCSRASPELSHAFSCFFPSSFTLNLVSTNINWEENISVDKLKICLWLIHLNNKQFYKEKGAHIPGVVLKCNTTTVFVIDIIFMTSLGLLIRLQIVLFGNKINWNKNPEWVDGRMRRFNL